LWRAPFRPSQSKESPQKGDSIQGQSIRRVQIHTERSSFIRPASTHLTPPRQRKGRKEPQNKTPKQSPCFMQHTSTDATHVENHNSKTNRPLEGQVSSYRPTFPYAKASKTGFAKATNGRRLWGSLIRRRDARMIHNSSSSSVISSSSSAYVMRTSLPP
jgi:hypothetical protein